MGVEKAGPTGKVRLLQNLLKIQVVSSVLEVNWSVNMLFSLAKFVTLNFMPNRGKL